MHGNARKTTDQREKTTVTDRYGRIVSVSRPKFTTAYKYRDDDKSLLEYESSSNGTRSDFQYDDLGRTQSVKESVPDGKWLKKTFAYDAAGKRVKMQVTQGTTALSTRYYIGGQYESDTQTGTEQFYLGGDAYSAPAVYHTKGCYYFFI